MTTLIDSQAAIVRAAAEAHLDVYNAQQALHRAQNNLAGQERLLRRSGTARKLSDEPRTVPVNDGEALVTVTFYTPDETFTYGVSRPL